MISRMTAVRPKAKQVTKPPIRAKTKKEHPNRIRALTKERKWTYDDVVLRVQKLARARKDAAHMNVHKITINRLATGASKLTQQWMEILGEVFGVPPSELIAEPVAQNLYRVRVVCALEAGVWRTSPELPAKEQFDIMIPNDQLAVAGVLYAGEIRGPSYNLRYPDKSIVVLSRLEQKPGEIIEGKRYHVRSMRDDGQVEDTIKCLTVDREGKYWLKPESDHPSHQEWLPLAGTDRLKVEIVGRVRGVFYRED
jgi:hypothetical protein